MTKREAIVLSAFTGTLLCDFDDYHKYVEELFGSTIFTQELPMLKEDIKVRAEADAMKILNNLTDIEQEERQEDTQAEMQDETHEKDPNIGQMVIN